MFIDESRLDMSSKLKKKQIKKCGSGEMFFCISTKFTLTECFYINILMLKKAYK